MMDGPIRRRSGTFARVAILIATLAFVVPALSQQPAPPLSITDESLPAFNVGMDIRVPLHAAGGVPPYHWTLTAGELPPGIDLDPAGSLFGRPSKPGTYAFTLTVTDSAVPAHSINKEFHVEVTPALLLDWLHPPAVHDNEIAGDVQVSNGTKEDDFDLTVIIVAVNEIGRATALGYQHFTLKPGVTNFAIHFGSTLAPGAYVVHADAIAEIAARNSILRQHLQSPALSIVQGP